MALDRQCDCTVAAILKLDMTERNFRLSVKAKDKWYKDLLSPGAADFLKFYKMLEGIQHGLVQCKYVFLLLHFLIWSELHRLNFLQPGRQKMIPLGFSSSVVSSLFFSELNSLILLQCGLLCIINNSQHRPTIIYKVWQEIIWSCMNGN